MVLPWLFYGWQTHRHSGFLLTMLSQMGMMIIFSLSYNMLMGQAGLLSFGHAVFFGLAGYSTIHFLDAAGAGRLPVPMELMPILSGLAGLCFGILFGYMATRQRGTAFAMITLGIGELVATAAIMFHHFFGGEGGRQHQPHDRKKPVRPVLRLVGAGLLPDPGVDGDRRVGNVVPDQDAARRDGQRNAATISSARNSWVTIRDACASCNSPCPACSPESAAVSMR